MGQQEIFCLYFLELLLRGLPHSGAQASSSLGSEGLRVQLPPGDPLHGGQ